MSDDEDDTLCPLCVEEMDLSDQNFLPCPCGYRVCMWCWHHIRENLNGLCPACRTPYNEDPHAFSAVDRQEIIKTNRERRLKEKQERSKETVKPAAQSSSNMVPSGAKPSSTAANIDRRHLHNYRVVQRNLVYVIGLPSSVAVNEDQLKRPEYFGQYGKISKVVIHRNNSSHSTVSGYVTYTHKEDARACIQALDGVWIDGHILRASFGTTKYCNNFIRGVPCNNPDCVYLHDLGDDDDRFTKEEIQHAGHTKLNAAPGKDQVLVTGNGGPSGTGKRPQGETVLPPPVFIQDIHAAIPAPVVRLGPASRGNSANTWNLSSPDLSAVADGTTSIGTTSSEKRSDTAKTPTVDASPTNASSKSFFGAVAGGVSSEAKALSGQQKNHTVIDSGPNPRNGINSSQDKEASSSSSHINRVDGKPTGKMAAELAKDVVAAHVTKDTVADSGTKKNNTLQAPPESSTQNTSISEKVTPEALRAKEETEEKTQLIDGLFELDSTVDLRFNGFSRCAVFPVPMSSLKITVWSGILESTSTSGLNTNPFKSLMLPYSELLELTIPPVDAVGLTLWPKPHAHYAQRRATTDAAIGSVIDTGSARNHSQRISVDDQRESSVTCSDASKSKLAPSVGSSEASEDARTSSASSVDESTLSQPVGFNALRQLFPGVKLSIGTSATTTAGSKRP